MLSWSRKLVMTMPALGGVAGAQILRRRHVVGVRGRGLYAVELAHERIQRRGTLRGANERSSPAGVPKVIAPTASPCLSATYHEQHHGVQDMVEMRAPR